jgi:translocation and assembly module TamB
VRRHLKIAAWILGALLLVTVLLSAGLVVFGNTAAGRAAIERLTYRLTDGHVQLSGLQGSFPQHLRADELDLKDGAGVWLTAREITVDWSVLAALAGRLQVDDLTATGVDMRRLPQSSSTGGGEASIPRIDAAHVSIDALKLGPELAGAPATLRLLGGAHLRSLHDMRFEVTAKRLDGDGDYALQLEFDRQRMDAVLSLQEPAGGPLESLLGLPELGGLHATAELSGPRAAEQFDLSLTAGVLRGSLQGSVNLSEMSGDVDFAFDSARMQPSPELGWNRAVLRGRSHGKFAAPSASGHLEVEGLVAPGGIAAAGITADLDAASGNAAVHALVRGLRIPGSAPELLSKDPLKIEASMRLDEAARPLQVMVSHPLFSLRAQVATAGKPGTTLDLRVPDLSPLAQLAGRSIRGSAVIAAQLDGYPAAPHISLDATAALRSGTGIWRDAVGDTAKLKLSATFVDQVLSVADLKLSGRAFAASADGVFGRGNLTGHWNLDVSDLHAVSPTIAGTLKASGSLNGPTNALNATALMRADISVQGAPKETLSAEAKLRGLPTAPAGSVIANGSLDGAPLQVNIDLEHNAQGVLRADIRQAHWKSANAMGDIIVAGGHGDAHGMLTLTVAELGDFQRLLGTDLKGRLNGSIALDPDGERSRMQLTLDAQGLVLGQLQGNAQIDAVGFTDSLAFNATIHVPNLDGTAAAVEAHGNLNLDARAVTLARAVFDYRGQALRLLSPARISFADGVSIDTIEVGALGAQLQVQGQISPTLDAHATLRHVEPALVNALVPQLLAAGLIEGHADLQGTLTAPTGELVLLAKGIRMADEAALGLPAADLGLTAQLHGHTAHIDAHLDAGAGSQINAVGDAPLAADGAVAMTISGKLDIGLINPLLEARGLHATGQLGIDATVAGSVADPQIGGTVNLTAGALRDYARGVNLSGINAELSGSGATLQIKSFTATAPPGTISVSGSVGILQAGMPVDLKISARNAQPIVSNLVTARLDADLALTGSARDHLDLRGNVHLIRTLIGIPNSLPPEVAVLDVRRRGKAVARITEKPLTFGLDVAVQAPQQIIVQGRGLDAEMGGELHVGGTTVEPVVTGGFDLQRGSFSLGSNKLNFTAGRVGFNGLGLKNKIDPTLDFTAQTTLADATTATMHITGLADAPVFEFTSNPPQPQDEIMGLLLFGVPPAQLTPIQLAQVGYALASLSGVGGNGGLNPLVKIQKTLGLDRLSFGAGQTTTTATGIESTGASIEAGRYVFKNVYVEAKQTTVGTSQVGAVVDLTKHLKLQTRLGNGTASVQGTTPENDPGSSVGLFYQIEY